MSKLLYNDNCLGTLRDAITDTSSTAYIVNSENFPSISDSSNDYFFLTIINDVNNSTEIVRVYRSNPHTGLLMFTRAHGGTSAKAFPLGSRVELRMDKIFFDSYNQLSRALPLFSYRMETPSNLPEGWYACDGREQQKTSVPGRFLTNLPATMKSNWGLKETATTITMPNFYINNSPAFVVPGIPGSTHEMNIYGSTSESATTPSKFIINTLAMTPAMFFGL